MSEDLTWSLEWGQRGTDLSVLAMERQPSSVTHSHSQTSFMCKSSLDLLFTRRAFKYLLDQVINVRAELEIYACEEETRMENKNRHLLWSPGSTHHGFHFYLGLMDDVPLCIHNDDAMM